MSDIVVRLAIMHTAHTGNGGFIFQQQLAASGTVSDLAALHAYRVADAVTAYNFVQFFVVQFKFLIVVHFAASFCICIN